MLEGKKQWALAGSVYSIVYTLRIGFGYLCVDVQLTLKCLL